MTETIETLFQQALTLHRANRLNEASALYQRVLALSPQHPRSLHLLGTIAYQLGRADIAVNLIESALAADPTPPAFHNDLGEAYRIQRRIAEAEREFRRAIELSPNLASAHNNLGILLQNDGRLDEALARFRRAAMLRPDSHEMHLNLGCALLATGAVEEAARSLEEARRLAPDDATVALDLGNARVKQDRLAEAESLYRQALAAKPGYVLAELNLGLALRELGRPEEALPHYERAAELDPTLPAVHWNDSVCRLLLGDYERGWRGFAWRWRATDIPLDELTTPEWQGDDLAGKRLLVHAEQGLGDTIQFVRFVPFLAPFGAGAVALLVQAPLLRLLRRGDFGCDIYGPDDKVPEYDLRIALMDLPLRLGTRVDTIPAADGPYLHADPALVVAWQERFAALPGRRVGMVWQGRRDHANDRHRSVAADTLAPLLALPGISWVSLQKDKSAGVLPGVLDIADDLGDMMDTAAAIMALDLIIAVDTSVAHLAGALGKPVWLLLPLAPDWRWLTERSDSPWYGSARLFRQSVRGDWAPVIAEVAAALSA